MQLHPAPGSKAFAAVHRAIFLRLEGNLSGLSALGTDRIVHHARSAGSGAIGLAGLTAGLAAGGLVLKALFGIEFLFTGGEHELLTTVFAYQRLVFVHGQVTPNKSMIGETPADLVFDPTHAIRKVALRRCALTRFSRGLHPGWTYI